MRTRVWKVDVLGVDQNLGGHELAVGESGEPVIEKTSWPISRGIRRTGRRARTVPGGDVHEDGSATFVENEPLGIKVDPDREELGAHGLYDSAVDTGMPHARPAA